jgi:hypothetical protein
MRWALPLGQAVCNSFEYKPYSLLLQGQNEAVHRIVVLLARGLVFIREACLCFFHARQVHRRSLLQCLAELVCLGEGLET